MKSKNIIFILSLSLLFVSCNRKEIVSSQVPSSITSNGTSFNSSNTQVTQFDFIQKITSAGSYTLTGTINGSILIDAPSDSDVELILDNVTITSNFNSPIYCKNANELKIKLVNNNIINDSRPQLNSASEDETQGKGTIYSKSDLKFVGSGSLVINANYNNGIHSTDDIKFKNTGRIDISSYNHSIKGNDSVSIESGTFNITSINGSGIKTEKTSISSKGNQKGYISITGGDIQINSKEDAIEAAFDVTIENNPSITINTSKYANYSTNRNLLNPGPGPGGMQEGNNDKADYSAKGIKSDNEIFIKGGTIDIKAYDDAIHANRGTLLENGNVGQGNVTISGGTLNLYASDDAIHADNINTIRGGTIDITNSYEGIEGNIINIYDGYIKVYSTDDGLNAANKAGVSPEINIYGGVIDITVYGGDVDGIDSNNSYTQTGGIVITKGGTGRMSTGLDTDGKCMITGGTLISFGKPENVPETSGSVRTYTLQGSYSIGNYKITNGTKEITISTKYSYSVIYIYSDETNNFVVTKM